MMIDSLGTPFSAGGLSCHCAMRRASGRRCYKMVSGRASR